MTIGQKIKELRIKNNLTQEKLAEFLCISFQAVSKWETNASVPDISMIAPLTKILNVTADELLCINCFEDDERYNALIAAYNQTYKTENIAKRQEICEIAVQEYPGDMKFLCNLAWAINNRSFEYEKDDEYAAQQEKAIKLFDAVIKNCGSVELKAEAILGITQMLGFRGRHKEAKRYADMLPENNCITKNEVLEYCLEGEELLLFKQKRIMSNLEGILWELYLLPTREVYTDLIEVLIQTMFPDENFIEFNHNLFNAYKKSVNNELQTQKKPDIEKIFNYLEKMLVSARKYDEIAFDKQGVHKYSAPWFSKIEVDTREWFGSEGTRMCEDMKKYLKDIKFDLIRTNERFENIYNSLK